jgi:hypothetical protein
MERVFLMKKGKVEASVLCQSKRNQAPPNNKDSFQGSVQSK